jgi:hypothetical protein
VDDIAPYAGPGSLVRHSALLWLGVVVAGAAWWWLRLRAEVAGGMAAAVAADLFRDVEGEGAPRGMPLAWIKICFRGTFAGWHVELLRGWRGDKRGGPVWLITSPILPPFTDEVRFDQLPEELAARARAFTANPWNQIRRDRVYRNAPPLRAGTREAISAALSEVATLARDLGKAAEQANAYAISVGFRYLRYREGRDELELQVDPLADGKRLLLLPTIESWAKDMPGWARPHRERIVARIRERLREDGGWIEG